MKGKIIFSALAFMVASCQQPVEMVEASSSRTHFETITKVIDGDTVVIDARWNPYPGIKWSVRMAGIDTPEKGYRAHCERERLLAADAKALTERLVAETLNRVRLRNVHSDKYGGRLDADIIMADGRNMSEELLRAGLAQRYDGNGPRPNWCDL